MGVTMDAIPPTFEFRKVENCNENETKTTEKGNREMHLRNINDFV